MRALLLQLLLALLAIPVIAEAQQPRVYRVGFLAPGGSYMASLDGLRAGLKELGMEEGTHLIFHVRDLKGDPKSIEAAARNLETEKVDLIYSVTTSVTVNVKRATKSVPIVFYAGADPVAVGLVKSFGKPGVRLTGIYGRAADLVGKRLELLKEINPGLRRVSYVYNPDNPVFQNSLTVAKDAARHLGVELIEWKVRSTDELLERLNGMRPGEIDALSYTDSMIISRQATIVPAATARKVLIVVSERSSVAGGALASYGVSYFINGRLAAKQVQRILQGADPAALPVEQVDRFHLALNLKTAKAFDLKIPASVLARADEVIE